MKMRLITLISLLLISTSGYSAERYVNAKIERIEACNSSGHNVLLFLKDTAGTAPSTSNGCSNDAVFPYIRLASTDYPAGLEDSFLSIALMAYASGKTLRIRYHDTNNQAISIAILH